MGSLFFSFAFRTVAFAQTFVDSNSVTFEGNVMDIRNTDNANWRFNIVLCEYNRFLR